MLHPGVCKLKRYVIAGLFVFAISCILCVMDSYAAFESLTETGGTIFEGMKKIIFAAAGFGIIAVALGGIFGVLNWKWLAAIIIGVVVIALTAGLLNYMVDGTGAKVTIPKITDTLVTPDK